MERNKLTTEHWPTFATLMRMLRPQANKRFGLSYLLSWVIDFLMFRIFIAAGINTELSQMASFSLAAISLFFLIISASHARPDQFGRALSWSRFPRYLVVSSIALFLRSAVLLLMIINWHWQPQLAILLAMLIGTGVLIIGNATYVIPESRSHEMSDSHWRLVTMVVLVYVSVLKLTFMGVVNLIPEEAYYWNYAQHLDLSYLDHPPMVAWLIWLSTAWLGKSEFLVRLPAFICWIVAAFFMFRLTVNLFDRNTALRTSLLLAVLPIYFGLGFFMTPDAPLYTTWVGCLYFLERALLSHHRKAWWGVGVCMGFGMLSKYTIALLGLGTLIFVLADQQSRRWLTRPEPYFAAIITLMLFTPVLVWNMQHDWASFMFQGSNRWNDSSKFHLHVLVGSAFLLLTPTTVLGVVNGLLPRNMLPVTSSHRSSTESRRYLWILAFTLVPLSVFVIFSLSHKVKLNWTAPVWLASIPLIAWNMMPRPGEIAGSMTQFIRRLWMPTIIGLVITLGASFYYISLELPGAGFGSPNRLFGPWRQLGEKVQAITKVVQAETQSEPIIVGMDKNFTSSLLSFYDFADNDAAMNTGGAHLFGGRSLMWAYWLPAAAVVGRNLLMVDFDRGRLGSPRLSQYFESTSGVFTQALQRNARVRGYFYWRIGYGYRGPHPNRKNMGQTEQSVPQS